MTDTIGPLDQDALQYGSMMPEGWQDQIEPTADRDERESANVRVSESARENPSV